MRLTAANIVGFVLLIAFAGRFAVLKHNYDLLVHEPNFLNREAGVTYLVHKGQAPFVLYMGDLLGTNIVSARQLSEWKPQSNQAAVVVPSIHPIGFNHVTTEVFLNAIANDHDVVLVDNFCFEGWDSVKDHAWFKGTNLTPGPYCLSEPQTRLIDRLIKQYQVKQVKIFADNKLYVDLIGSFLKYLKGMNVPYQIVWVGI